ncbi:MAG: cupin domain-containing protein [Gammaproteobacteria bacterium]|nr:cupin domain-containing protein [Gammaproteobacteria bacterium]
MIPKDPINLVEAEQESIRIGRQIRDLRKAKKMTLQDMADAISRSVGYVSQVERGVSSLPIPLLQQISKVLDVQITWFFHAAEQQPLREIGHIVRAGARRQIKFAGTGIKEELLSPSLGGESLMLLVTLATSAESDAQPRTRESEESGYILSGELLLTVDGEDFELGEGDSFSIAAEEAHHLRNTSKVEDCKIIWIITPPFY